MEHTQAPIVLDTWRILGDLLVTTRVMKIYDLQISFSHSNEVYYLPLRF